MTLTLTSDDFESHIIVNVSSTLTNTTIWFVAALSLIVDVRTYGRTFLPGLLGHLGGDDVITRFITIVDIPLQRTDTIEHNEPA